VYRFLSDLIHNSETFASMRLRGVIFDSCPSRVHIISGMRFFMGFYNQPFIVKYLLAAFLFVWMVVVTIVSRCAECISLPWIPADDYWSFMCEDSASCPHLYLYSVQDTLIPYRDVEEMIAVRHRRGVHVMTQRWDDSAHVAHFVSHRETYVTACLDFFQHCSQTA